MKQHSNGRDLIHGLALLTQLGTTMAVCVIIGVLAGRFLDGIFGTSPWLLLIFTILGALSSFKIMYDLAMHSQRK